MKSAMFKAFTELNSSIYITNASLFGLFLYLVVLFGSNEAEQCCKA